jgi:hypothetical protein
MDYGSSDGATLPTYASPVLLAYKDFVVRERTSLQLRGEFFNVFNQSQWSTINTAAKFNQTTGQQINTLFGTATADRGPRVIQVALRLTF